MSNPKLISPALFKNSGDTSITEVYITEVNAEVDVIPGNRRLSYYKDNDRIRVLNLKYYNELNGLLYHPRSASKDDKITRKFIVIEGDLNNTHQESYVKVTSDNEIFDDSNPSTNDFQKRVVKVFDELSSDDLSTLGNFYDLINLYDIGGINHIVNSIMASGGYQQYIKFYDVSNDSYELFSKLESIPPINESPTPEERHPVSDVSNFALLFTIALSLGVIAHKSIYYETILDENNTLIGFGDLKLKFNYESLIRKDSYLNAELVPYRFIGDYVNLRDIYDKVYLRDLLRIYYKSTENPLIYYTNQSSTINLNYITSNYSIDYPEINPIDNFYRLVVCQIDMDILYYESGKSPEYRYLYFEFQVKETPYVVYALNDDYEVRSTQGGYGSYIDQKLIDKGFDSSILYERPFISVTKDRVIYYPGSNPIFPFVIRSCDISKIESGIDWYLSHATVNSLLESVTLDNTINSQTSPDTINGMQK